MVYYGLNMVHYGLLWFTMVYYGLLWFKHEKMRVYYGFSTCSVRRNPDVAPRLTSGGYEDKVTVITPINMLLIGGGEF